MLADVNIWLRAPHRRAAHIPEAVPARPAETNAQREADHMRWNHPVIDADQHVDEPLDLWEKYFPHRRDPAHCHRRAIYRGLRASRSRGRIGPG
jgi:hypothetical protein